MSNCCGEDYHYADCPIRMGYVNDYSDYGNDGWDDGGWDNPEPELRDPADCEHGNWNGTRDNEMFCIDCETVIGKIVDCDNPDCFYGYVTTDKPSLFPGKFVKEDCPKKCSMGSVYVYN